MIETLSRGRTDDNMAEDILLDLDAIVRRHPWWRARALLTLDLLADLGVSPPSGVLDAGCGWGVTFHALERRGYRVVGLDVSRRMLERLDAPRRMLWEADLAQPLATPPTRFDAVLALDVIEHLDDDRAAVATLAALVEPGGVVVLSVPALPELYSEFDRVQGHRRRYLPDTLRAAFDETGLTVERLFWWGAWLVPTLRRQRRRPRAQAGEAAALTYQRYLRLPPWPAPWLLRAPFAFEHGRALRQRLTTGTSLFAVARRPALSVARPSPSTAFLT